MKRTSRIFKICAILTCLCMSLVLFTACGGGTSESSSSDTSASGSASGSSDNAYDASDTIVIPILTNLNSSLGESCQCAAELAKQELEAAGAFGGRTIEFQYIEVGTDQQASINASQKAASIEEANAIICFYKSQWQIAANDIFLQAEKPAMCLGNSVAVSEMGNDYVYQTRALDKYPSRALADVAVNVVGLKNPAIIYFTNASGMSQYEATKERLEELGVSFAIELAFEDLSVTDFTSLITQVKGSDADGLIVYTSGGEDGYLLASQLHDQGYDKPICCGVSMMSTTTINNASGGLEGWYGVAECSMAREQFATYYENVMQMDGWPSDYYPTWTDAVVYDTIYLLAKAYDKVGSCEPHALNEGLQQIEQGDYAGAMYDYYYADDHSFGHQMFEAHVENGEVVTGEQFYVE
jgi:ABC-type branched-subunit amino acid transport system substrate-binding protein